MFEFKSLFSFFKLSFYIIVLFHFYIAFRICFSSSIKSSSETLIRSAIIQVIILERIDRLTILSLQIHYHSIFLQPASE